MMANQRSLKVIALVSGGKDSFFSLLHCLRQGHDVVALANLFPPPTSAVATATTTTTTPTAAAAAAAAADIGHHDEHDLDSFMYQTVGHEIVPLYAAATGIPIFRQPIVGGAACEERDYRCAGGGSDDDGPDETESMVPLLQTIMKRFPEANALCSGAILSTYQRTRVESVALRLGLVSLAYLWKYPILPPPSSPHCQLPAVEAPEGTDDNGDDSRLLHDMAAAGLEARLVKVASAGLDESFLWQPLTTPSGARMVKLAVERFSGGGLGAALGEGGEFETIVVDGPPDLFRKRIIVPDEYRTVISQGGGASCILLRGAHVEDKPPELDPADFPVRQPALLDARFEVLLRTLSRSQGPIALSDGAVKSSILTSSTAPSRAAREILTWTIVADICPPKIEAEVASFVGAVRQAVLSAGRSLCEVTNTLVVLSDMSHFAMFNKEYAKLFTDPIPPSRVTVSSGDFLPGGRRILMYMSMPRVKLNRGERTGLHVQSCSYWAPANIGPYSQAVVVPAAKELRAVYVAGQIPLIPASMSLPLFGEQAVEGQVVLSLQHLWRIGAEMGVQCWTSAVAYFARTDPIEYMARKSKLAFRAWTRMHSPPEGLVEESGGESDPWDVQYNHQRRGLGHGDGRRVRSTLPDFNVLLGTGTLSPPIFAVEVESLPRMAMVEWHAHVGLGKVGARCVEMLCRPFDQDVKGWGSWHTIVRGDGGVLVQTVLAAKDVRGQEHDDTRPLTEIYRASLDAIGFEAEPDDDNPYLVYAHEFRPPWLEWRTASWRNQLRLHSEIPCYSLWLGCTPLKCVALFQTTLVDDRLKIRALID